MFELFEVVKLAYSINNLQKGSIGTIVEKYDDDVYEVEFLDKDGYVIDCIALNAKQISKLSEEELKQL